MSKIPVYFHSEDISYILENKNQIREWVIKVITSENSKPGETPRLRLAQVNFIFCSDKYLHKINLTYLKKDCYTDTITFDYTENRQLSGDIFISIERVKENAKKFNTGFTDELHRVVIHGILHLLGYKDKTRTQKAIMRKKEDFYLSLLSFDK